MTTSRSATRKTSPRGRRKPRRRIHRGRMLLLCSVLALVIIAVMAIVSRSCGTESGLIRGGGDFRTPVPSAIERGRADAQRALDAPAGSMERQEALLDIRAREYRLRRSGAPRAADDYLDAATDLLRTHGAI